MDLDDVVTRTPLVDIVVVTHANGLEIEWVNIMGEYDGWVPLTKPDGTHVFTVIDNV